MDGALDLDEQLCFALYTASRVTQGAYREVLGELNLTYPQWLVLLALWKDDGATVRELGDRLLLDSGTLSPLLGRLEARGVLERRRTSQDGRLVTVHLTDAGWGLREHAAEVQSCLLATVAMSPEELRTLRDLARRLVATAAPGDHTTQDHSSTQDHSTTEGKNR